MEEGGRIIFHVDMDAFYAAIEVRDDPSLKGLPLVIGADPRGGRGRGVVCTASYEARKFGIRSAMPISQAYRLAPHARYVPPNFSKYGPASEAVMEVLERYADVLEVVGMDEAYLDVTTQTQGDWGLAHSLALSLQAAVKRATGLSCSVGVAPNKSAAKVASDFRKPHGVTVVSQKQLLGFLAPLACRKLNGCGPKTASLLAEEGITTVAQLAATPVAELESILGSHGHWLHAIANGLDDRRVLAEHGERKSRGNETTFHHDRDRPSQVAETALHLLDELLEGQERDGRAFSTLTVKVRYSGFTTVTRAHTLPSPLEPGHAGLRDTARHATAELLAPLLDGRRVRLVGVRLSGFSAAVGQQSLASYGVAPNVPSLLSGLAGAAAALHLGPRPAPGGFDPGGLRWTRLASFGS